MPASDRLRRWAIILQEFNFDIRYVKGTLHSDIDCLTMAPVDGEIDSYLEDRVLALGAQPSGAPNKVRARIVAVDTATWAEATKKDKEGAEHLARARARTKGYRIFNG